MILRIALAFAGLCAACPSEPQPSTAPASGSTAEQPTQEASRKAPEGEAERPSAVRADPPVAATHGFSFFRIDMKDLACPKLADGDCVSWVEVHGDGTMRMDAWGEPGDEVHEARLSEDELDRLIPVLAAPDLLGLLDRDPPCDASNDSERVLVRLDAGEHAATTGYCNDAPIQSVRGTLVSLAAKRFPGHPMITPPF